MTEKERIKRSRIHWDNIINCAQKQPPTTPVDYSVLEKAGQNISGDECELCKKYHGTPFYCKKCPLANDGHWCGYNDSPYCKVLETKTWIDFINAATGMRDILKILEEKYD